MTLWDLHKNGIFILNKKVFNSEMSDAMSDALKKEYEIAIDNYFSLSIDIYDGKECFIVSTWEATQRLNHLEKLMFGYSNPTHPYSIWKS
jgi:L-lysine 2,3-aminomutase